MEDYNGSKHFKKDSPEYTTRLPEDQETSATPNNYWTTSNGAFAFNETNTGNYQRNENLAKVEMFVLMAIFILNLFGNSAVLLGIYFRKKKMTRMYYFILHLTIADLTTAFCNVLTQFIWEVTYRFQGGNALCKFVKYVQILGPYSSSNILVVTALDRYQAICFPLNNYNWSPKKSNMMLALAWILSLLQCLPQIYIFSYQQVKPITLKDPEPESDCWGTFIEDWGEKAYVAWYSTTVFLIPLIILVFAYVCITRAIVDNYNLKLATNNCEDYKLETTKYDLTERDLSPRHANSCVDDYVLREQTLSPSSYTSGTIVLPNAEESLPKKIFYKKTKSTLFTSKEGDMQEGNRVMLAVHDIGENNVSHQLLKNERGQKLYTKNPERNSYMIPTRKDINLFSDLLDKNDLEKNHVSLKHNPHSTHAHVQLSSKNQTNHQQYHTQLYNICNLSSTSSYQSNVSTCKGNANTRAKHFDPTRFDATESEKDKNKCCRFARSLLRRSKSESSLSPKTSREESTDSSDNGANNPTHISSFLDQQQPRSHSVKWISKAKIKTIKLTVTIIICYICCSLPFIAAQCWVVFDPFARSSSFFTGATFTILTLLASLNSCVNPYIFLFFNPNLLRNCYRGILHPKQISRQLSEIGRL